jgi:hypothetical protein
MSSSALRGAMSRSAMQATGIGRMGSFPLLPEQS